MVSHLKRKMCVKLSWAYSNLTIYIIIFIGDNIALQSSRWEVPYDATNRYYDPNFHGGPAYVTSYRGYRGWLATAHYALQDNVGVTGYYGFNNKTNKSIGDNDKLPNYYRVDLNYQF